MGVKPKILHLGTGAFSNLCGAAEIDWAEKYMTDEFTKDLPKCADCLLAYERIYGCDKLNNLQEDFKKPRLIDEKINDSQTNVKRLKTLRMYLTT